jgi:hypothetical protein
MENKAVKHGTVSSKRFTHYSMLRTTERLLVSASSAAPPARPACAAPSTSSARLHA